MSRPELEHILEGALLAAGEPLSVERLRSLFDEHEQPEPAAIHAALERLAEAYAGRGVEVKALASGYRIQVRETLAPWVSRLWEEKPGRYSRALLETLAIIAYRQPITRSEIEEIRGVSVSSGIMRTLQERGWVRIAGHRDVPGRPAVFATTRAFLDYFNLQGLDQLPTLMALRDPDDEQPELDLRFTEGHGEGEAPDGETEPDARA